MTNVKCWSVVGVQLGPFMSFFELRFEIEFMFCFDDSLCGREFSNTIISRNSIHLAKAKNGHTVMPWKESKLTEYVEVENIPFLARESDEVLSSSPYEGEGILKDSVKMPVLPPEKLFANITTNSSHRLLDAVFQSPPKSITPKQYAFNHTFITLPIYLFIIYFNFLFFSYLVVILNKKPLLPSPCDLNISTISSDPEKPVTQLVKALTLEDSNQCSIDKFEDALDVIPENWIFPVPKRALPTIVEVGAAAELSRKDEENIDATLITVTSSVLEPVISVRQSTPFIFAELHQELDRILRDLPIIEAMKFGINILERGNAIIEKNRSQQA
ncbi:uncharacterized protein LOC131427409 [Malaya genurostris]|uniref:uncharacterized protein LOC131427409 n=1 Tax=Malaya genurostris TaxID=325434 RepID=UPI0026F3FD26|nr:uncharacterized protein LOC131427409 [Malaya genurostris]